MFNAIPLHVGSPSRRSCRFCWTEPGGKEPARNCRTGRPQAAKCGYLFERMTSPRL